MQQCQTAASTTTSEAVKAKLVDILRHMQVLLDTSVQTKVDYDTVVDGMRVFLTLCSSINMSGSQAFTPNPVDRDMAMNAFQILTVAT